MLRKGEGGKENAYDDDDLLIILNGDRAYGGKEGEGNLASRSLQSCFSCSQALHIAVIRYTIIIMCRMLYISICVVYHIIYSVFFCFPIENAVLTLFYPL